MTQRRYPTGQWNKIFKESGAVFTAVQEDIPRIASLFRKEHLRTILDLGSGSGRHIVYLAKRGFKVYGIDAASYGIRLTGSRLRKEGLMALLTVGDIYQKLPYQDSFFDAIISTQTLHHGTLRQIQGLIREIQRDSQARRIALCHSQEESRQKPVQERGFVENEDDWPKDNHSAQP